MSTAQVGGTTTRAIPRKAGWTMRARRAREGRPRRSLSVAWVTALALASAAFVAVHDAAEPAFGERALPTTDQGSHLADWVRLATGGVSSADARACLDAYKQMSPAQRFGAFLSQYSEGRISVLLESLPNHEAAGPYREQVGQLLRWVQEAETRKASGMTDDQMARVQAEFQMAEAQQDAQRKLHAMAQDGDVHPTPPLSDVGKDRMRNPGPTTVTPTTVTARDEINVWDEMTEAEHEAWKDRGDTVISALVAHAAENHPELELTEKNLRADFDGIERRGPGVLAVGGAAGSVRVAVFGYRFVEAAEADPAYVLSVVVHEVFGHPEYGVYGSEYHLALYDRAQAKIPGYTKPAAGTPARRAEVDTYAYQETEIYALLRSLPYHTPLNEQDAGRYLSINPTPTVAARLGLVRREWEQGIAVALVRGLHQRLRQDPRISDAAIDAFEAGVTSRFPTDATMILE